MRYTRLAFLSTTGLLGVLVLAYVVIELLRGHAPFAMIEWNKGGKFLTYSFSSIILLGTAIGVASDYLQRTQRR